MTDRRIARRFVATLPLIAAAAAFATHITLAQVATSVEVAQKDIEFHPDHVQIKVGGTVTFINEDPFGHNVYSDSPGVEFDLGRQKEGQRDVVTFKKVGTFTAQCRIHPKMRLEIVVTP